MKSLRYCEAVDDLNRRRRWKDFSIKNSKEVPAEVLRESMLFRKKIAHDLEMAGFHLTKNNEEG